MPPPSDNNIHQLDQHTTQHFNEHVTTSIRQEFVTTHSVHTPTNVNIVSAITPSHCVHISQSIIPPVDFNPLPSGIFSPVRVDKLEFYLVHHPDRQFVKFVVDGFRFGFDIGFIGVHSITLPRNLLSARNNHKHVSTAISKEIHRHHTSGPFAASPFTNLCSPLGAVPKKDGTYRLILDLSSPRGSSVNGGIPDNTYSVKYFIV